MITCTTKPPEEYNVVVGEGEVWGLWDTYGYDQELFCFISRISPAMFMYEPGFEDLPLGKVVVEDPNEQNTIDTMSESINGITVREIQHYYNPIEMFKLFTTTDIQHLSFIKGYPINDVISAMRMRVLQFKEHYRGLLNVSGSGVQQVQFGSSISNIEQMELDLFISGMRKAMDNLEEG